MYTAQLIQIEYLWKNAQSNDFFFLQARTKRKKTWTQQLSRLCLCKPPIFCHAQMLGNLWIAPHPQGALLYKLMNTRETHTLLTTQYMYVVKPQKVVRWLWKLLVVFCYLFFTSLCTVWWWQNEKSKKEGNGNLGIHLWPCLHYLKMNS